MGDPVGVNSYPDGTWQLRDINEEVHFKRHGRHLVTNILPLVLRLIINIKVNTLCIYILIKKKRNKWKNECI